MSENILNAERLDGVLVIALKPRDVIIRTSIPFYGCNFTLVTAPSFWGLLKLWWTLIRPSRKLFKGAAPLAMVNERPIIAPVSAYRSLYPMIGKPEEQE